MPTVFVTGANRGLGFEFVRQYAAEGWDVIAACRDQAKADKLKALAAQNKNVGVEALDVGDFKAVKALAEKLQGISIDLLINNAGIYAGNSASRSATEADSSQTFGSIAPEAWQKVLRINTIAPIMIIQAFTDHLSRGKSPKVVNITSKMGSIAEMGQNYIAYRTSKAALNAAMVTISHDLKAKKITIVNLHPGWVKTDMGGPQAPVVPEVSITGMRTVIAKLTPANSGQFIAYDGKVIPW